MPPWAIWTKRELAGVERIVQAVTQAGAPEEIEELRLRKFRRASDAAMHGIDDLDEPRGEIGKRRVGRHVALVGARLRLEPLLQQLGVVADGRLVLAKDPRDFVQYTDESWTAIARVLGEVGAAPERLRLRGEEHGQRPAALLAELVQRAHVDRIDVRALLAVDLDVDEQVVHHGGGGFVLEALMRHDVAPMAGRVADREQDRLAGRLASASASGPQAHHCTGLSLCWRR